MTDWYLFIKSRKCMFEPTEEITTLVIQAKGNKNLLT